MSAGDYELRRCGSCNGSGFNDDVTTSEIEEYGEAAFACPRCEGTGLREKSR